ncbi:MAG: hypothetical protein IKO03_05535 [Lachnospiraceae bacterium]|nr:hypothetical protein [Lachnospiraceae bacterium]MBR4606363.1 hypothetical protein [Lachnospiraceae bacterium]
MLEQITENMYYQYFIGIPGFQSEPPYVPSLQVEFRKCLNDEIMIEINEMIIDYNSPDDPGPGIGGGSDSDKSSVESENSETIILDATYAPQNVSYPQDVNLLNEARRTLKE